MKPIQAERLARAMERVKHAQTDASEKMIPVPVLGGVELVELKSIEWVEANRDYLSLSSGGRSFMIRKTLAAFANETFPELRQSHRSYLVNPRLVKKVIPKPKGEAVLCFSSGKQVPVSRGYKDILADIISPGA